MPMRLFSQEQIYGAVDIPWASAIDAIAGGTILAGDIVVQNGVSSGRIQVVQADADAAATARGRLYVSTGGVSSGDQVTVVPWARVQGGVATGVNPTGAAVDTSAGAADDPVYLASTPSGGWTITRPADPAEQIVVGTISVVSATAGEIMLAPGDSASGFASLSDFLLPDKSVAALDFRQGANPYLRFRTSDLTEAMFIEPNGASGDVTATAHSGLRIGSESSTAYTAAGDTSGHGIFIKTAAGGACVAQANAGGSLQFLLGAGGSSATAGIAGGAGAGYLVQSGPGGASTNTGDAGAGGAADVTTGAGGSKSGAGATGAGGQGGDRTVTLGAGGASSATGASAAGRAGAFNVVGSAGGEQSGAGASGAGGAGSAVAVTCGDGGDASGAGSTGNGGAGGGFAVELGSGGTTVGGSPGADGAITFTKRALVHTVGGTVLRTVDESATVATETVFAGGSLTIPANRLAVGSIAHVKALVRVASVSGAGATARVQIKLNGAGGTLVFDAAAVPVAVGGDEALFTIDAWLGVRTAGALGKATGVMKYSVALVNTDTSAAGGIDAMDVAGSTAGTWEVSVDTTAPNTLDVTGETDGAATTLALEFCRIFIEG